MKYWYKQIRKLLKQFKGSYKIDFYYTVTVYGREVGGMDQWNIQYKQLSRYVSLSVGSSIEHNFYTIYNL
jgi:hypothetical protein